MYLLALFYDDLWLLGHPFIKKIRCGIFKIRHGLLCLPSSIFIGLQAQRRSNMPRLFRIPNYPLKYGNLGLFLVEFMNFPWMFISQAQIWDFLSLWFDFSLSPAMNSEWTYLSQFVWKVTLGSADWTWWRTDNWNWLLKVMLWLKVISTKKNSF